MQSAFGQTNAIVHMMHQVVCGKLAKAGSGGLLYAMVRATGKDKDMAAEGQIAEIMWMAETVRAFRYMAECEAHADQWGTWMPLRRPLDTSRNMFPRMYPKMVETVQLGFKFAHGDSVPSRLLQLIVDDVGQYFQTVNLDSQSRVALFRLAHDNNRFPGFGNRQALYERFFFGPRALMASAYFRSLDRDIYMDRVNELLK